MMTFKSLVATASIIVLALAAQANQSPDQEVKSILQSAGQEAQADKAIVLLKKGLDLEGQVSDSVKLALYYQLGVFYSRIFINDSARIFFDKAHSLIGTSKDTRELEVEIYNGMGNLNRSLSQNEAAIESYNKGLELIANDMSYDNPSQESRLVGNIAGIYYDLERFEDAHRYASMSRDIIVKNQLHERMFLSNLMMAFATRALNRLDEAINYNQEVLALIDDNDQYEYYRPHSFYNIASIYQQQSNFNLAVENFRLAREAAVKNKEYEVEVSCLIAMTEIILEQNKLNNGFEYVRDAERIAQANGFLHKMMQVQKLKVDLFKKANDPTSALTFQDRYIALKDSLINLETSAKIDELNTKYETTKKEQEIELLTAQNDLADSQLTAKNRLITMIVISSFLLTVLAVYFLISQKQKHTLQEKLLYAEIDDLRHQINTVMVKDGFQLDLPLEDFNQKVNNALSAREYEILKLAITKKANKEIAEEVFVSVSTVKFHLSNIFSKLGVANRIEALDYIVQKHS